MKNPMKKKKSILKDEERKKVQQLMWGREQLERKTVPTEQMDYLQ